MTEIGGGGGCGGDPHPLYKWKLQISVRRQSPIDVEHLETKKKILKKRAYLVHAFDCTLNAFLFNDNRYHKQLSTSTFLFLIKFDYNSTFDLIINLFLLNSNLPGAFYSKKLGFTLNIDSLWNLV